MRKDTEVYHEDIMYDYYNESTQPGTCGLCGKKDDTVTLTIDPLAHVISGDKTLYWLCDECCDCLHQET